MRIDWTKKFREWTIYFSQERKKENLSENWSVKETDQKYMDVPKILSYCNQVPTLTYLA